jgi:mono/diheme cytochrome c family protein
MTSLKTNLLILAVLALGLSACSDKSKPNIEIIQDFMESPALKAQEYDESAPDHRGMRTPPSHTVPIGFEAYKYSGDLAGADKNVNPMAQDFSEEVLMKGQKAYETHCMVCHGMKAEGGESTSVGQMMALKPPTLNSDKVKGWTDGHIYHVITEGQGLMNPYAAHVPQSARWQLVNYIRHLQKNAN